MLSSSSDGIAIELSENIYNARGLVEETRRYDVSDALGATYAATITYYDHGGRAVEVHTAGSPVRRYAYDARGRQTEAASWAAVSSPYGDVELSRVETVYDANDRALATVRSEDPGPGGANIRTFTHSWYDESGRLTATANYGTASAGGYVYTEVGPERGDPPASVGGLGDALVTLYEYDTAGRQWRVTHPDGTVTQTEYDGLGRVLRTIENADGAPTRTTEYVYDAQGRLASMTAVEEGQTTELAYDAPVMPRYDLTGGFTGGLNFAGWGAESQHNGLVSRVLYPDGRTIDYSYYNDGSVAAREDSRGTRVLYEYDEDGRLISTYVDDRDYFDPNPAVLGEPFWAPIGRVREIQYSYDNAGRREFTNAYTFIGGQRFDLATNQYLYDASGNLRFEVQDHQFRELPSFWNREPGACSKTVEYTWEYSAALTGGRYRPTELIYPARRGAANSLELTFGYAAGIDDAIDRVSSISDAAGALAEYDYLGIARRTGLALGGGLINQTYATGPGAGFPGLDRYGRVTDLHYQGGGGTLHQYQYGYDTAGNRTFARVKQFPTHDGQTQTTHDNDRSYAYGYDDLQQLILADLGKLNEANTAIILEDLNVPLARSQVWRLDTLGNWTGTPGSERTDYVLGTPSAMLDTTHTVNLANALDAVTADDGSGPITRENIHDGAGNLVWDKVFFYQYDAFGHLCRVFEGHDLNPTDFDESGRLIELEPPAAPLLGDPIAEFFYDGLGRLIAKDQRVDADCQTGGGATCTVQEDYWYDGARRIFESEYYESNTAAHLSAAYGVPLTEYREREYVYGPDYVDEFVCYLDEGSPAQPMYMLQDANYNVVGLVDGDEQSATWGHVIAQQQFTPYGEIAVADNPVDTSQGAQGPGPITNRVGHQGLFFERFYTEFESKVLDPALLDPSQLPPPAAGRPAAAGFYVARNRAYDPSLGRYLSRDSNETGLILIAAVFNGQILVALAPAVDAPAHYGDGANLYAYLGANPGNGLDPLGLFDWFDAVDEVVWEIQAARAIALEKGKLFWASMAEQAAIAAMQAAIVYATGGFGVLAVGAWNAGEAAIDIYENGLDWGNGVQLAFGAAPWVRLGVAKAMAGVGAAKAGLRARRGGRFKPGSFDIINVSRLPNSHLLRRPPYRGAAPRGIDGKRVEIHHVNQNPEGPYVEMLKSEHSRLGKPNPGLSVEQRRLFELARKRYWAREWDAGRFRDLPR